MMNRDQELREALEKIIIREHTEKFMHELNDVGVQYYYGGLMPTGLINIDDMKYAYTHKTLRVSQEQFIHYAHFVKGKMSCKNHIAFVLHSIIPKTDPDTLEPYFNVRCAYIEKEIG